MWREVLVVENAVQALPREDNCATRHLEAGMRKAAQEAAKMYAELYVFSAIVDILEGGARFSPDGQVTVGKIIALCRKECDRLLCRYDVKINQIEGAPT